MLPGVANDEDRILRADFGEEVSHLPSASKRGLVQHVEMSAGRVASRALLPALLQKALQRFSGDPGIAQLIRGLEVGAKPSTA